MEILLLFKALISRLLFIGHGICAVYLHYMSPPAEQRDTYDWFLVLPLAFILVEAGITLIYRKGVEYKYIWPSGFLYISCLVPVIWMIELDLLEVRIRDHEATFSNVVNNNTKVNAPVTESQNQQMRGELLLKALLGSNELRKKVCELGLIIGIIIGRWLVPRGTLTRDQLSTLLLGYVSNSADILEIFTTFEEPEVFDQRAVTVAIMAIFTLSVYQFALVTTATIESESDVKERNMRLNAQRNKIHPSNGRVRRLTQHKISRDEYIQEVRTRRVTLHSMPERESRGRGRKVSVPERTQSDPRIPSRKNGLPPLQRKPRAVNGDAAEKTDDKIKRRTIHGEVFQILVTLLMQDGPFFILRVYLIIEYSVASEMHIFFTCKNAIVSILLVYRLLILSCSGKDEEAILDRVEADTKLKNIQRAIENIKLNDIESSKMYVG